MRSNNCRIKVRCQPASVKNDNGKQHYWCWDYDRFFYYYYCNYHKWNPSNQWRLVEKRTNLWHFKFVALGESWHHEKNLVQYWNTQKIMFILPYCVDSCAWQNLALHNILLIWFCPFYESRQLLNCTNIIILHKLDCTWCEFHVQKHGHFFQKLNKMFIFKLSLIQYLDSAWKIDQWVQTSLLLAQIHLILG